jgi:hypothetical protein
LELRHHGATKGRLLRRSGTPSPLRRWRKKGLAVQKTELFFRIQQSRKIANKAYGRKRKGVKQEKEHGVMQERTYAVSRGKESEVGKHC